MLRPVSCLLLAAAALAASAAATTPRDLPVSDVFYPTGKFAPLAAGEYQASKFPFPVRLRLSGRWNGAQWKANNFAPEEIAQRHLKCPNVCRPPYYGWAGIAKGGLSATRPPQALILVVAGYGRTPSVAATVAALHRPTGVDYEPATTVEIAGRSGTQFSGVTVGSANHVFTPFSPPSHGAVAGTADAIEMHGGGHPFRFTVLNVRGKTVVVLVGSLVLGAGEFETVLGQADGLLASLRFPG